MADDHAPPKAFTAHNIRLDDGMRTRPDLVRIEDDPWLVASVRAIKMIFPSGVGGLRIADLGCLEGGYAVEFARLGFGEVLGVEVRSSNFLCCRMIKERVDLPNLSFVQDDAWNLHKYGKFDAVFCCGLLYHLDRPKAFLRLVSSYCRKLLIINTHFAPQGDTDRFQLSPLVDNEGAAGRWYVEYPDDWRGDRDAARWSSWDNQSSFWLTRGHLAQAVRDAGFPMVFEQLDVIDQLANGVVDEYRLLSHRCMMLGIKC